MSVDDLNDAAELADSLSRSRHQRVRLVHDGSNAGPAKEALSAER
jgi:hypothetical protein